MISKGRCLFLIKKDEDRNYRIVFLRKVGEEIDLRYNCIRNERGIEYNYLRFNCIGGYIFVGM